MNKVCKRDLIGFDDSIMILVGWPLGSILMSLLLYSQDYKAGNWEVVRICIPLSFAHTGAFWFALRKIYMLVRVRYPKYEQVYARLLWLIPAFLVIYFSVNAVFGLFMGLLSPTHRHEPEFIPTFIGSFMLAGFVLMIYEVMGYQNQLRKATVERDQLERQNVESQLQGLRNQVNPHFLFNSLNTLAYLIPEDSQKAVRFVHQLSKVYRYVLDSRESRLIALREELTFLEAYIFLQKERFGQSLHVNIGELPDPNKCAIVPLTLQILFENAIKHNIVSVEKPLIIDVFVENNHIVVRNNHQPKQQRMTSTGVGLQNIKDRYRLLSNQTVEVFVTAASFTVAFPILEL
jgi:two-component system, LytTR family, sensor kinase